MEKFVEITVAFILSVSILFLIIIAGALMGALAGAIVGIFFSGPILSTFASFGVTGLSMWKLGATLGFVAGFFRSVKGE